MTRFRKKAKWPRMSPSESNRCSASGSDASIGLPGDLGEAAKAKKKAQDDSAAAREAANDAAQAEWMAKTFG